MPTSRRLAWARERATGGKDGSTATSGPNSNQPMEIQLERAHGPERPVRVGRASKISTGPGSQTRSKPGQRDSLRAATRSTSQERAAGRHPPGAQLGKPGRSHRTDNGARSDRPAVQSLFSPRQSPGTLEVTGPSPGGRTRLGRQSTVQPRRPGRRQATIKLGLPLIY